MREGWALVFADRGQESAVARALLALSSHPREVVAQRGGREFLVPEELAETFRKSLNRPVRRKKESSNDG